MAIKNLRSLHVCIAIVILTNAVSSLEIITRSQWQAKPPKGRTVIPHQLTHVIIHHTYIPEACFTTNDCIKAMQWIQDFHQNDRQWDDIGYSFAIGGDGKIYEGRGFNVVGAHAPGYNDKSIGIVFIGDYRTILPSPKMLEAAHKLIQYGIFKGNLKWDYILHGHRQVRDTECPGDALYNEIKTWPHFVEIHKR
ncbi:peptidoglycan-recognition protein LB-like [Condylostylus longicornis]|uniref:peptidoglycan-recognition protein LB-like n=1 Tax=Condylostylus longicornis TaxID=2530218 RepID=UPI00244D9B35|nr:peptidoglycan-recognition protein LB-like [Condylostylus longicornis]